jgi:hypothetical protein
LRAADTAALELDEVAPDPVPEANALTGLAAAACPVLGVVDGLEVRFDSVELMEMS